MIRLRADRKPGYDQYEVYLLSNHRYFRGGRWHKIGTLSHEQAWTVGARAELQVLPAYVAFAHIEPVFTISGRTLRKHRHLWRWLRRLDDRGERKLGVSKASDYFKVSWYGRS